MTPDKNLGGAEQGDNFDLGFVFPRFALLNLCMIK